MHHEVGPVPHTVNFRRWVDAMVVRMLAAPVLAVALVMALLSLSRWLLLPLLESMAHHPNILLTLGAEVISRSHLVVEIVSIALPLQLLLPAVQRRPKIGTYEYWLDVLYWHQNLLLAFVLGPTALVVLNEWVWSWTSGPWLQGLSSLPVWAQVLFAVWLTDLVVYWRHRSEHVFRPLWSFHAVHHSAEQVDVLTTLRLHPIEIVFSTVTLYVLMLVGLSVEAVAVGYGLYTWWNYFIHTNVRVRFSGVMKYVLVSPFMHQWHHALDREAMGKNVGVVFAWNDWLFGSAYHPSHWPTRFGIDAPPEDQIPQSYWQQMLYPLTYARNGVCRWVAASRKSTIK